MSDCLLRSSRISILIFRSRLAVAMCSRSMASRASSSAPVIRETRCLNRPAVTAYGGMLCLASGPGVGEMTADVADVDDTA
jgi:hypothetical protein